MCCPKKWPPKPIMKEFKEIMPKELSNGLPLDRDIQHRIILIPGTTLPNLPHYQMSSEEHRILQGHVEDLVCKGLV